LQLTSLADRLKSFFSRETTDGMKHRVILIVSALAVLLLLLLTLYAHSVRAQLMTTLESRFVSQSHLRADALLVPIDNARRNVRFLTQVPAVQGLVRASLNHGFDAQEQSSYEAWQRRLSGLFVGFASANPDVSQVRLIGLDRNGRELVRVNRDHDRITITPDSELQEKGGQVYFKEASKLKKGEVYISDINLNRDHQKIEVPYVPTIRAATPVYDTQGQLFGILIINFRAQPMLQGLTNNLSKTFRVYLTNSDGDYLASPNFADNFGFDLGMRHVWSDDFKLLGSREDHIQSYESRAYPLHGKVHVYTLQLGLDPHHPQRVLNLSMIASDSAISTEVYSRLAILCGSILGSMLLMGSMFYIYWRQRLKAQAAQARFVAIVESSNDAIVAMSMTGVITNWNKSAERMYGYPAELAIGQLERELCPSNFAPAQDADYQTRISRGQTVADVQSVNHDRAGRVFDVSITLAPIRDLNHRVIGISKTVRDITEQKRAEQHIQLLNESLEQQVVERTEKIEAFSQLQRAILDSAGLAIIAGDPDNRITLFNPAAERMLGYSAAEVMGQTPKAFHVEAEVIARAAELSAQFGETIEPGLEVFTANVLRGLPEEHEWTYIRKDGSRLPVLLTITAWRDKAGEVMGYLGMALDVSQQQQDRHNLQVLSDHFQRAIEVAELGTWTWNVRDNSRTWSDRMRAMYNVPLDAHPDTFRDYWRASVHPDDMAQANAALERATAGLEPYYSTFRILQQDGSVRYMQAAGLMEFGPDGKPLLMSGFNRDVTAQFEHEAMLHAAMASAKAASEAKSAFLANMSHEIRTPMNAILGMQQLLHLTALDGRQYDYVNKTEVAAQTLLGILDDILDFSKVEAGKLTLEIRDFNFDKLLRDVGTILAGNIGLKEVEVLFDVDAAVPAWIKGDALRLQQVLINLASNAIKFTEHGEIVLSVQFQVLADAPLRLAIEVRDTGIGIPEQMRQHIFEGFSQAESSTARRYGGSGLGLAISQRLVRLMGGDISFDSEVGVGSTFRFTIPCTVAEGPPLQSPRAVAELHGLKVLVVDDNPHARQVLVNMVNQFGWQAHEADSGATALKTLEGSLLTGQRFDVVLVDWRMPEMDGWQTTQRIQDLYRSTAAPLVVMVTASDRGKTDAQQEMLETQLDGFLIKPIAASMLFDAVADARVGRHHLASMAIPRLMQQRLLGVHILVVEDNMTNQQVARELLSAEGASVSVADNGQRAIAAATQSTDLDIVLMDIQMPDMDGYTATREIRKTIDAAQLPIIALTANAMASDREAALASGMNDHVGKPFDLNQLVSVICRLLDRPLDSAVVPAKPQAQPALTASANQIDVVNALQRFGGNSVVYGRALRSFAFDAKALMQRLLVLRTTLDDRDLPQTLHALKGLASTIGASNLSNLAALAEKSSLAEFTAQWPTLQRSAERAIQQAEQLAALYTEQQHEVAPSDSTAPRLALGAGLDTLSRMLRDSNMGALDLFEQLQSAYAQHYPHAFVQLSQAMSQLNFPQAQRYCDDLKLLAEEQ
jgi:PAS domain S-box-containing protein